MDFVDEQAQLHFRTCTHCTSLHLHLLQRKCVTCVLPSHPIYYCSTQAALPPPSTTLQQRVRELEQQLAQGQPGSSSSRTTLGGSPLGGHAAHAPEAAAERGREQKGSGGVSEADQLALPMVAQLRQELGQAQAQLVQWQQLLKVRV